MKKYLSLIAAILCLALVLPAVSYADDDGDFASPFDGGRIDVEDLSVPDPGDDPADDREENADDSDGGSAPDDAFDGDYEVFKGSDGSETAVYDNGSVVTKYPDGTTKAVDYRGNRHVEDSDGNYSVHMPDGSVATQYADGRQSLTEPDGKTTTLNPDGSFTESFESTGVSMDYDSDGHLTGIGFTGSDERIGTNEYGEYENGEITGPDGASLKVTDDGMSIVTPNGMKAEYKIKGDGDSKDGFTESYTVTSADGTKSSWDVTTKNARDAEGNYTGKSVESSGYIEATDNSRFDYVQRLDYDKNGDLSMIGSTVSQITCPDGSTLWKDHNSEAWEYNDPNTGDLIAVDKDGRLTDYKDSKGNEWNVIYDKEGNVRAAEIRYEDGAVLKKDPGGSSTFTLPDGTKYESDGKGNVYKDGKQIKKDGEWVEGYDPANDTAEGGNTYGTEPYETEPYETEPYETEPVQTEEQTDAGETGLALSRVAGTYGVSGQATWVDFDDDEYSGTESASATVTFAASGNGMITMSIGGETYGPRNYDAGIGTCSFEVEDGLVVFVTFSESTGGVSVNMSWDQTFDDGREYGYLAGSKN